MFSIYYWGLVVHLARTDRGRKPTVLFSFTRSYQFICTLVKHDFWTKLHTDIPDQVIHRLLIPHNLSLLLLSRNCTFPSFLDVLVKVDVFIPACQLLSITKTTIFCNTGKLLPFKSWSRIMFYCYCNCSVDSTVLWIILWTHGCCVTLLILRNACTNNTL